MSVAVAEPSTEPLSLPEEIASPRAKLVCLYLASEGRTTVDELADRLSMPKMALFSVLGTLSGRGLVEADGDAYRLV